MPAGSLIKLYFGANNWGLPPTRASLDAYVAMLEGTGLPWSVAVLGGDLLATPLAEYALELGGHLRVGLEDYGGPGQPSNVELIERAIELCGRKGRPVASATEAADILGIRLYVSCGRGYPGVALHLWYSGQVSAVPQFAHFV